MHSCNPQQTTLLIPLDMSLQLHTIAMHHSLGSKQFSHTPQHRVLMHLTVQQLTVVEYYWFRFSQEESFPQDRTVGISVNQLSVTSGGGGLQNMHRRRKQGGSGGLHPPCCRGPHLQIAKIAVRQSWLQFARVCPFNH